MCYVRGHPYDYDLWERRGAEGWSYSNVLPYFKKAETYSHSTVVDCRSSSLQNAQIQGPNDPYRGHNGPLIVTRGSADHPLHQVIDWQNLYPIKNSKGLARLRKVS